MKTLINIILFTVLIQTLTAAPVKSWTYAYNDTGARKQVVEDGELTDDTINIAGQVISRTGLPENSYAYDNDGNLESDPNWDYIFNEANQLIRMDNKEAIGYSVAFSYDFSGRRYEKSVLLEDVLTERTTYVYDGQRVIAEIDSLEENIEDHELERTYTHGLYVDEVLAYTDHVDDLNSETYYLTTDRQFSVRAVVDSLGDVIEERNYDPFGKDLNGVAETSDLAYGFTGRRYDAESDLYYFRARYYSSDLGQFISRDPIGYNGGGMNVYAGYFSQIFLMDYKGLGPNGAACKFSNTCAKNVANMIKTSKDLAQRIGEINKWNDPDFYHNHEPVAPHNVGWPSNANKYKEYLGHVKHASQLVGTLLYCEYVILVQWARRECDECDTDKIPGWSIDVPAYKPYDSNKYLDLGWAGWLPDWDYDTAGEYGAYTAAGALTLIAVIKAAPAIAVGSVSVQQTAAGALTAVKGVTSLAR